MSTYLAKNERIQFGARFRAAVAAAGYATNAAVLAKIFNAHTECGEVTAASVRKWINGETFPTQARLNELACWLMVSPKWLRFGEDNLCLTLMNPDHFNTETELAAILGDFRRLDAGSRRLFTGTVEVMLQLQETNKLV